MPPQRINEPYVDDVGNPPAVRKLHVCRKHGRAYCTKPRCASKIMKRLVRTRQRR